MGKKVEREDEDRDDEVRYDTIAYEEDTHTAVKHKMSPVTDIRVTHKDIDRYACTPGVPSMRLRHAEQEDRARNSTLSGVSEENS